LLFIVVRKSDFRFINAFAAFALTIRCFHRSHLNQVYRDGIMTVLEGTAMGLSTTRQAARQALVQRVETHRELTAIATQWKVLQNNGLTTPYQTYDWVRAWSDTHGQPAGSEIAAVTCHDARGRVIALLPLALGDWHGLRVGRFIGGKHSNLNMGLFEPAAMHGLSDSDVRFVLRSVADRHGLDFFHFENQPLQWQGLPNPMTLLPHQPSASSAWKTALELDGEAKVRSLMSSESRKKLRHKEKKLSAFGPVTYAEALNPGEVDEILQAFYQQKSERFKALGITDPFSGSDVRAFLQAAATSGIGEKTPAVSLFAMRVGDRIVSVFGGSVHQGRFSGMFTSFDGDPAVARYSPGDLLLLHLIKTMCGRGLSAFDLGTGDAGYKTDYCNVEEPLFDSFLPFSFKGQMAAATLRTMQKLKRATKKSGMASAIISRLRQARSSR
jgi:CelD/BcsL family acetyltransferase involved in cellulose biosynthesis